VVHVSTAAVWGDAAGLITEDTPPGVHCASAYARSKREADAIAWHLHEHHGLPLVMIYPAAVIGPHDPKASGRYIDRVARGALPAQVMTHHVISLVHVRDVADGIVRALDKPGNIGARYLLSAGSLTWGELNELIAQASGTPLPRMHLPDWLTLVGASTLTAAATLARRPPALDLALDQMLLMYQGFRVDGSRAERELGVRYTPIAAAVAEEIAEPAVAHA
jgi:dihydroflavonol-4-reductase